MRLIQQQMTQEFISKINRDIRTTDRYGRSGTFVILPDGLHLATVTFYVERWNRRRFVVHAYAIPGLPLPDPLSRFIYNNSDASSEVWACTVDPADDSDASYIARVLEGLYDMKQANSENVYRNA